MKGELNKNKEISSKLKKDLEKNILPPEYKIIDIVVNGRRIRANINKMLKIANAENRSEIIAAQNKASSNYQYFSRVDASLEDLVIRKEEDFELWLAKKMSVYEGKDASSEAAKKRLVMTDSEDEYKKRSSELNDLKYMKRQAEIAKKSLDKQISLIQSIGAMVRSDTSEPSPTSGQDY